MANISKRLELKVNGKHESLVLRVRTIEHFTHPFSIDFKDFFRSPMIMDLAFTSVTNCLFLPYIYIERYLHCIVSGSHPVILFV